MNDIRVSPVASGWNYTVLIGADPDGQGGYWPGSEDRIIKGWARDRNAARERAHDVLNRVVGDE